MPIETKTISELREHRFLVPSYQRGYRWTEHEVRALLDDVHEFRAGENQRYCIQPLIVKRRDNGYFEVVDGQQRLTTVFIFMKIAAQEIRSATPPYVLEYATRPKSRGFLDQLSDEAALDGSDNIDFYHIAQAYQAMNAWLDEQPDKSVAIQTLNTKFRQSVFFIWYEVPDDSDPIDVFTKVNLGKIPLTNSELIKALLMSKDNYETEQEDIHKRQVEMSIAWDRIEHGLRNNSLWYFINQEGRTGTRIDLLFDVLAQECNAELNSPVPEGQKYFPFLVFSALFSESSNKRVCVKNIWDDIEKLYSEVADWYADLDQYHIIGFLIASGVDIREIFTITRGKRKSQVRSHLIEAVKSKISRPDDLGELTYETSWERNRIRRILLLFNIATLVCRSEKQYRFPFDMYKGHTKAQLRWDIDHIHATADESDEADDSLGNLTLLDAGTNRASGNIPFIKKREEIIRRESRGLFVPLCTKNVFLKAYSRDVSDMGKWGEQDKADYVQAIENTFAAFFAGVDND